MSSSCPCLPRRAGRVVSTIPRHPQPAPSVPVPAARRPACPLPPRPCPTVTPVTGDSRHTAQGPATRHPPPAPQGGRTPQGPGQRSIYTTRRVFFTRFRPDIGASCGRTWVCPFGPFRTRSDKPPFAPVCGATLLFWHLLGVSQLARRSLPEPRHLVPVPAYGDRVFGCMPVVRPLSQCPKRWGVFPPHQRLLVKGSGSLLRHPASGARPLRARSGSWCRNRVQGLWAMPNILFCARSYTEVQ